KLDQAQFRELEAFAKFGSDLDAATKLTIERGRRNQEILKQAQYSPIPVEQQVAIIFASTKGFIDDVPVKDVKTFQQEYLALLASQRKATLTAARAGKFDAATTNVLGQVAKDLAKKYAQ